MNESLTETGLIIIQANFHGKGIIPPGLIGVDEETPNDSNMRKKNNNGVFENIYPDYCSPSKILDGLKNNGWVMVDSFWQKRIDRKNPGGHYYIIRWTFNKAALAIPSERLIKTKEIAEESLQNIFNNYVWIVRVFRNPLSRKGEIAEGFDSISINLVSGRELFTQDTRRCYMSGGVKIFRFEKLELINTIGHISIL